MQYNHKTSSQMDTLTRKHRPYANQNKITLDSLSLIFPGVEVNFSMLSLYGVFISQLVRFARWCTYFPSQNLHSLVNYSLRLKKIIGFEFERYSDSIQNVFIRCWAFVAYFAFSVHFFIISGSFVCIAVYTVDSTISYVTNMGKYMYVKHNEPRLIIAGNIVVCSPYMEFPYSAIISAASTALSMLAAFYIVFAEICTCPCKAMCASCCKACGTRGCARICTVHVDETNKNGDPDRQHLINSEPEVSQWSYGEEDAVFQCCTYRIVYANNKKAEPDVST